MRYAGNIPAKATKKRKALHSYHKGNTAAKPSRVQQAGSVYLIFSGSLPLTTLPLGVLSCLSSAMPQCAQILFPGFLYNCWLLRIRTCDEN
jgi:hypothetical protein